jgi:hypothetical protein
MKTAVEVELYALIYNLGHCEEEVLFYNFFRNWFVVAVGAMLIICAALQKITHTYSGNLEVVVLWVFPLIGSALLTLFFLSQSDFETVHDYQLRFYRQAGLQVKRLILLESHDCLVIWGSIKSRPIVLEAGLKRARAIRLGVSVLHSRFGTVVANHRYTGRILKIKGIIPRTGYHLPIVFEGQAKLDDPRSLITLLAEGVGVESVITREVRKRVRHSLKRWPATKHRTYLRRLRGKTALLEGLSFRFDKLTIN